MSFTGYFKKFTQTEVDAVNYFGISLQNLLILLHWSLRTQYSQSKLAYNIVNRVNEGKTAQKDAEKIMESIGLSWSETKSLSNNFLLYEQKYKTKSMKYLLVIIIGLIFNALSVYSYSETLHQLKERYEIIEKELELYHVEL